MALPKQEILEKYLMVIRQGIVQGRILAEQKKSYEQIYDILDAIHNIPELLVKWEDCDESWLIEELKRYDKKWQSKYSGSLSEIVRKKPKSASK
jgi:hypothetical protein